MPISFDPAKRDKTLTERGLDFADATAVFAGITLTLADTRRDYGERRWQSYGLLDGRLVMVVWTERGEDRHVMSMRNAMSASKPSSESSWVDPDDAPEWTTEMFDRAELRIGEKIIRRGRPPGSAKAQVSLRLDQDVIAAFRAQGPGWQSRMNEALRKAAGV